MKQAPVAILLAFVAVTVQLVSGVQDLEQKYSYATDLQAGYRVHWNVDLVEQKIEFALNVSTKGWIGFGISPTGKMLESDIVIGWVNKDGSAQFHVSTNQCCSVGVKISCSVGVKINNA